MNFFVKMVARARWIALSAKLRWESIGVKTVLEGGYFVMIAWLRNMNSIHCI
jgi:hypothetical protein